MNEQTIYEQVMAVLHSIAITVNDLLMVGTFLTIIGAFYGIRRLDESHRGFWLWCWAICSAPAGFYITRWWMGNHPLGGLIILGIGSLAGIWFVKNLIVGKGLEESANLLQGHIVAAVAIGIMATAAPWAINQVRNCSTDLINNKTETATKNKKAESFMDKAKQLVTPSFYKVEAGGFEVWVNRGLVPDSPIEKKILNDRLRDLAAWFAADPNDSKMEHLVIGGVLKKKGGVDDIAIICSDGDEEDIPDPAIVIPGSGIDINGKPGLAVVSPAPVKIKITENGDVEIAQANFNITINCYGKVTPGQINWNN